MQCINDTGELSRGKQRAQGQPRLHKTTSELTGAEPAAKAREDCAGPPAFRPPAASPPARPPAHSLAHSSARASSAPPSSSSSSRSNSSSGSITAEPTGRGSFGRRPWRLKFAAPETRRCAAHAQERPPRARGSRALSSGKHRAGPETLSRLPACRMCGPAGSPRPRSPHAPFFRSETATQVFQDGLELTALPRVPLSIAVITVPSLRSHLELSHQSPASVF